MQRVIATLVFLIGLLTASATHAAGFPVTVAHAFGETTIPAEPKRVVSIGYVEQDFLYALGIAPVGVRAWWGDHPYATWPWAEAARLAVHAEPAVMPGEELNLEWVLSQNPDLILAVYQDIDQPTYDALSKIAPVVGMPKGYPVWGAPWQEELRLIDTATSGDTTKAEQVIAGLDTKLAAVRQAHPEFAGKTATNVYLNAGNFLAYGPEDTASRFLIGLGFAFPPQLEGKGDSNNAITISPENLSLLDLDAVLWAIEAGDTATRPTIEAMPLYGSLRLAREGRSLWLDDGKGTFTGALSFQSPLSIAYLLDTLPPMLSATLDGDPATNAVPAK